ncbi:alpha-tocopherol transfer protein-like [Caerostris extrusa]|uniref:Alpha-tocopherol transfer protein-like n=1 Tax=Caerostris extrusa TaxID=172846 RepID=A0AAV4T4I2_CAEEX|nr:alpha-tocopherol transfer protein-like [Caerostris extrusa]
MAMMNEEELYPFLMSFVPDPFLRKCEIELNETPENKIKGLEELKKMLLTHKLTSKVAYNDDYLITYLRYSKYNVIRAFERLRTMSNFRKNYSNVLKSLPDVYFLSKPSSTQFMRVLPKKMSRWMYYSYI